MRDNADEEDVTAFCRELRPRLVGALSLYCGDLAVAEELTQETLSRVWEHWPKVRGLAFPEGWAHRVGLNLASSWLRRRHAEQRARAKLDGRAQIDAAPDTAAAVAVRRAVAALPRRRRTALVLRYYLDLSVEQTADQMGCAAGTVRALTSQALATLRDEAGLADLEVHDA